MKANTSIAKLNLGVNIHTKKKKKGIDNFSHFKMNITLLGEAEEKLLVKH